jgi:hypothetical protein
LAENGSEALKRLHAQPDISLLILDLSVSVMTGETGHPPDQSGSPKHSDYPV